MQNVLISGGTGLIGRQLSKLLADNGYQVRILSRNADLKSQSNYFYWNIKSGEIDEKAFENLDYIIHLAGANVAEGKWFEARKKSIVESRVKSGELLFSTVKKLNIPLKAFISASGTGFYGARTSNHIHDESEKRGTDFLAKVCCEWESESMKFKASGIRTVVLRTGIVLAKTGGALEKMKTPVKFFLGSALGSGKQHMPWIHINDMCKIYLHAMKNDHMEGYFNAASPDRQTNKSFTKALCKAMERPFIPFPVPAFMLKLMYGEMASIILEGSRVSVEKIQATGFNFEFIKLEDALKDLV